MTLLLVLGERVRRLINDATAEHWFLSYIDSLCRFRLWNTAALVSPVPPCQDRVLCFSYRICRQVAQPFYPMTVL